VPGYEQIRVCAQTFSFTNLTARAAPYAEYRVPHIAKPVAAYSRLLWRSIPVKALPQSVMQKFERCFYRLVPA
jgi:hypothetical protein